MAVPPGQFIALQAITALKGTISGYAVSIGNFGITYFKKFFINLILHWFNSTLPPELGPTFGSMLSMVNFFSPEKIR